MSAQAIPPTVFTNKTGYLAGETVLIGGTGFAAGEVVTLRVTHSDGGAEAGASHDAFTALANENGAIAAVWTLGAGSAEDLAGNSFVLTASRVPSGALAPVAFNRIAVVETTRFDYQPGETAEIVGAGFRPGESVTVQVVHSNGLNGGNGHAPFDVTADENGRITTPWFVHPDDSLDSIFRLTARGAESRLVATSTFTDLLVVTEDDLGPDDPTSGAQTDLSQMSSNPGVPSGAVGITWNWDDTARNGGNTVDACALVDTSNPIDGLADFAFCVTAGGDPLAQQTIRLWSCNNTRSDRCAGRQLVATASGTGVLTLPSPYLSSASTSVGPANSDPFAGEGDHNDNNDCNGDNCLTRDTIANVTLQLADVGGVSVARLINVCSYPSEEPNSNPSDCVITPLRGTLEIVKVADPDDNTAFTFDASVAARNGDDQWTINGSGSVTAILYDTQSSQSDPDPERVILNLTEQALQGWNLQSASCVIEDFTPPETGTSGATGVTGVEIRAGFTTVCTFTNNRPRGSIQIRKTTVGGIAGQTYQFGFTPVGFGSAFSITVGPDASANSSVFSGVLVGGTYSVSETSAPTGWNETSSGCTIDGVAIGSPSSITVQENKTTICTFTNTEDQNVTRGNLKIAKVFDPLTSGFTGSFSIPYDCNDGTDHDGTATLEAGDDVTITGIPPGTSCTVTEPNLPTAPAGWTFGVPSIVGSPASITAGTTSTVTVTNTISRDTGSLRIVKTFDPLTSGFSGTFAINYDCNDGTTHDGTANLGAGGETTIGGIPTGTSCTVSEPTLPTAPTGWTFGTPTIVTSPQVITTKDTTYTVTVTNTISRDTGSLRIVKNFDPLTSGFSSTFAINYDCNDGTAHDGTANLAAGGETTVSGIPTGTSCTVSEPTLPTAPTGWTFGTPSVATSPQVITAKDTTYTVTVTNTISRDLGSLRIRKVFDPLTSGFGDTFAINYDCNDGTAHDGTANLAAGGETTIAGIPTGTSCTVSEPTLPTAPTGWTFGTPSVATSPQVITAKDTTYTVTVTNTISRDLGSLRIRKVFNPLTSGFNGTFAINYDCNDGTAHDGTANLAAGGYATITGIPTGTSCTVTEPTLPTAPNGWTFGTPSVVTSPQVITAKDTTYTVTVYNTITRNVGSLTISKVVNGAPEGFTGTFGYNVLCEGDGGTYSGTIAYPTPGFVTISNIPTGNRCGVRETSQSAAPTGYTWGTVSITGNPATIAVTPTATVTITNPVTARAKVVKTVYNGSTGQNDLPTGTQSFTFQLRSGASTTQAGTILESINATAANGGVLNFTTVLTPGSGYQMCEVVMPGWMTTLGPPLYTVFNPSGDNSVVCTNFTATAGQTATFTINNIPPPGGLTRTIGFWKNWSSCTSGGQAPKLDQTLFLAKPAGISIGNLILNGGATANLSPDCDEAVRILNKSTVNNGKKMASDPAFNLAAQLLAAKLNVQAGAGSCPNSITAINNAQALLVLINFNGITHNTMSVSQINLANNLAAQLDSYNQDNSTFCSVP